MQEKYEGFFISDSHLETNFLNICKCFRLTEQLKKWQNMNSHSPLLLRRGFFAIMTFLFDVISTVGFGIALLLAFRIQKNLLGHPSRFFLCLFLFVYILAGTTNILRHSGLTTLLDRYEYYAQLLFPPLFLFFIFPIFSLYVFSVFMKHDFATRIKAEASLKESEAKYRNLFEDSLEGICVSRENHVVEANKAFLDLFGYDSLADINGKPFFGDLCEQGDSEQPMVIDAGNLAPDTRYECRIIRKDGEFREVEISASAILREDNQYIQSTIIDITAKNQAAEVVRQAKEQWERTFNTVPELISILDERNRFVRVNKKLAEKLKTDPDSLIGQDFHKVVHGIEGGLENPLSATLDIDPNQTVEIYEEGQDGFYLVSISPLTNYEGKFIGSVRVAHDITELKNVEAKLEAARAFLQSIIDGVSDSIMVIDTDYRVRLINKAAAELHGVSLPLADNHFCHKVSHNSDIPCHGDEHPCPLQTVTETKKPIILNHKHQKPDGTIYSVEIAASPLFNQAGEVTGIAEIGRDITEKLQREEEDKKFKERLFQQQKNQSIATLARGIAHDFNNMLGTVLGNVELFQMGSESREVECGMVETIGSAAQHMTDLTRQLMAYAEEGAYKIEELDLNLIIRNTLKITRRGITADIEVKTDLDPELWHIVGDPGQMSQMLVNMLTNGFEAMAETGGTLHITTSNIEKEQKWECSHHNLHNAGPYILIRIADTGPGISAEVADQIFEPFVTTKFLGRGLGLAAVIGIVKGHGGCVTVDHDMPVGACFNVLLPVKKEPLA
jgi:PAS domain S-box-containing protein